MAHFFDSGFCVRQPSWHGLENLLSEYPDSWDDARMAAGLMWEPRIVPMYRKVIGEGGVELFEAVAGGRIVERDDDGAVLGTVSDNFALISHGEMGEIIEAIVGQPNVKFETAGSVKGGAQVWALVKLDEPYTIPGDNDPAGDPILHYPYLSLLNSHDGTGACKVLLTQVRVVCWNTIQAASAEGDRHGHQFSFRHVGKPMERIEDARAALTGARDEAQAWVTLASELHGMPIGDREVAQFLSEFIPEPPAGITSDRVKANIARDRARFMAAFNSETNIGQHGTGLGLFNASVEYLDHLRRFRSTDTYLGRTILRPEPLKARALTLVRELAGASN